MTDEGQINIFKSLDFIRDQAPIYAKAKSARVFLEEFRKSKKAILMREAEKAGHKTAATQEREAYANEEYQTLLKGLAEAVEEEERLKWMMVAAQAKISAWQTIEATKREEMRVIK